MKLFKKISWIIVALAISIAAFAEDADIASYCDTCTEELNECDPCLVECDECYEMSQNKPYEQGYEICEGTLPKAYNAPARIDICEGIDAFITVSFIYWEMLGDQLDLGGVSINSTPVEFQVIKFKTDFEPGFKLGVGMHFNHDDWDLYAEYTRLHETKSTTYTPPSSVVGTFFTAWLYADPGPIDFSLIDGDIKATWKMGLDKIDLELGRSYYLGTNLIARPFVGGSVHWLDQRYDLNLPSGVDSSQLIFGPFKSSTKTDSWAIGPRFGLKTSWLFYERFRLFGYGAISLLFSENEIKGSSQDSSNSYVLKKVDKCILRDVEEMMIGFGWGSYFSNDKWHMDLSVAYEAQRYSHTNYMVNPSTIVQETIQVKPGDLFLHGLTLAVRFDF